MPRDADDVLSSAVFSVYGKGDHPWSIISHADKGVAGGKTVSLSACRHRWVLWILRMPPAVVELYRYSDGPRGECCAVNVASEDTRVLRDFVEEIHSLCGGRGKLEYGSFVQAKEGALSICPVNETIKRLTDGTWKEQVSFAEGSGGCLDKKQQAVSGSGQEPRMPA